MNIPMTIKLHNLQLLAKIGVFDWERQSIRVFPTQVKMQISTDEGIRSEVLESTLDYVELEDFLLKQAAAQEWQLIERLLEHLVEAAIDKFSRIDEIEITIHKPQALDKSDDVSVSYSKKRSEN